MKADLQKVDQKPALQKPAFQKADPRGVLTGVHFMDGDHACCEGALAAGSRFAAGYPITPSTEVVERFASRVPTVGGTFIQMEDELAASITWLASDDASNVNGVILPVDGGWAAI